MNQWKEWHSIKFLQTLGKEHHTVVPFTDMTTKLVTEMAECGVTQVTPSTTPVNLIIPNDKESCRCTLTI